MAWNPITPIKGSTTPAPVATGSGWQNISASSNQNTPTAPISAGKNAVVPPTGETISSSALSGSLGGGYGTSNINDPASGKPLLTYENEGAQSSQLLSDRTAPAFDPTVPQKIDPATLQDPRMSETISQGIKNAIGGSTFNELDHIMPLELGGSNNKSNLRLEGADNPFAPYGAGNPTPTDSLEDSLKEQVTSGKISLADGWKLMAQAKGLTLPEQGGTVPQMNQTQTSTDTNLNPIQKAANYIENAFNNPGKTADSIFNELGGQTIIHPIQTLQTIVSNAQSDADTVIQNVVKSANDLNHNLGANLVGMTTAPLGKGTNTKEVPVAKQVASVLNFFTSMASISLMPISETYKIMSSIPVVKPAADAMGFLFNKTGQLASWGADQMLDSLVKAKCVSQDTANMLQQSVESVAALAGQIALGGYIFEHITGMMKAKGTITPIEEKNITNDVQKQAEEISNSEVVPKPTLEEVAQRNEVKPVQEGKTVDLSNKPINDVEAPDKPNMYQAIIDKLTQPEQLPKFADVLPPETKVDVKGSDSDYKVTKDNGGAKMTVVDLSTGNEEEVAREDVSKVKSTSDEIVKTRTTGGLKPVEGTGEIKTRGLSKSVEASAIQNGLETSLGELPEYRTIDMKDQAEKVAKYMNDKPDEAREVAMGRRQAPKGILPEAVYRAHVTEANANGDFELQKELANSELARAGTTMGQRLQALRGIADEDPVEAIKELQKLREEAANKKMTSESKGIDDSISKAKSERLSGKIKVDLAEFIKNLTC